MRHKKVPFMIPSLLLIALLFSVVAFLTLPKLISRASTSSDLYLDGSTIQVAIYRGGAACQGCPEAVAKMLQQDDRYNYQIKYIGENEADKLASASLDDIDIYVQPGGGLVREDWPKLTVAGQEAVRQYVESGGRMLGICLGGFFFDQFEGDGWGWIDGVGTYSGALRADGRIARTSWGDEVRDNYWADGQHFRELNDNTQVLARYTDNQLPVAIVHTLPNGGVLAGVGTHVEANADWYSAQAVGDDDGYDGDLGIRLVHSLLNTPSN